MAHLRITRTNFRYLCCVEQTRAVYRPHHIYPQTTATVLASERNSVDFLQEEVCSNLSYRLVFFDTYTLKNDNPLFIYVFTDDCNLLMSTGFIKIHNFDYSSA